MTRRRATAAAEEATSERSLDNECLQANTQALTALEKRLQVVQQILDEVANELGWLSRNMPDFLPGNGIAKAEETVYCMECESEPIRSLAEALRHGWTELMLHEGNYVGMCPECLQREDEQVEATRRIAQPVQDCSDSGADANEIEQRSAADAVDQQEDKEAPPDTTCSPAQPVAKRRKSPSKQTLCIRMFMHEHMTALVRTVGYDGFPASEGPARMRPLIEKFGEPVMRAAADEIVEIDNTQTPAIARLTSHARKLAAGILGRPKEKSPTPLQSPSVAESSAQADESASGPAELPQQIANESSTAQVRSKRQRRNTKTS